MASSTLSDRKAPVVVPSAPPLKPSKLPAHLRLPIVLVLNLGLQSILWTLASNFLRNELGDISIKPADDDFVNPLTRLVYKVIIIWLGWRLDYDFIDISSLTVVTNIPFAYLLATYYNISPLTVTTLVVNEVISITIPTYLLRPRSAVNNPNTPLPNRYLLNSSQVHISNGLMATGVYVVVLFSAIKTDQLTLFLISHFDLPTLEAVHAETTWTIASKVIVAGFATKIFLLNPSIGAVKSPGDATPVKPFDGATASFPETIKHNVWFFSRRTRTLIRQSSILSVFILANTVQRSLSLIGADFVGAVGYSLVWISASVICAAWWVWIGDADA